MFSLVDVDMFWRPQIFTGFFFKDKNLYCFICSVIDGDLRENSRGLFRGDTSVCRNWKQIKYLLGSNSGLSLARTYGLSMWDLCYEFLKCRMWNNFGVEFKKNWNLFYILILITLTLDSFVAHQKFCPIKTDKYLMSIYLKYRETYCSCGEIFK
jgi:hypothetical protein